VTGCTALDPDSKKHCAVRLKPKEDWVDDKLVEKLHQENRIRPTTLFSTIDAGATGRAWVLPNEGDVAPSNAGGFVYIFHDLANPESRKKAKPPLLFPFTVEDLTSTTKLPS